MDKNSIIVLTGPTGIGKTEVSLELFKLIDRVEVVSVDSMAVYKGMDIGTSKPRKDIQAKIPHHMIDIVDYSQSFDAAEYVSRASEVITQVISRGNIPFIVGGSVMYLYSLLDGIFKGPSCNHEIRERLIKRSEDEGLEKLYGELKELDSEAAAKIHQNDLRRIVRALEVYYLTGERISALKTKREGISSKYEISIYALCDKRLRIYRRIDQRVDGMISRGLVDEVCGLMDRISLTAYQGAGYKEIIGHINGEYGLDEAIRLIKRNSRRFAKRQLSWLRRDQRIKWINLSDFDSSFSIADFIFNDLKNR
ncbi:MAG: tRNA (adenosine(37)-N6)-dimethylallyltransferase MiaA [Candidatus Kaelpia aquatica]|nr:tRNA (adenosine(37)-N6)-dimethylallyltransferase MiaA [Candidatus Kaelpia aquatica]